MMAQTVYIHKALLCEFNKVMISWDPRANLSMSTTASLSPASLPVKRKTRRDVREKGGFPISPFAFCPHHCQIELVVIIREQKSFFSHFIYPPHVARVCSEHFQIFKGNDWLVCSLNQLQTTNSRTIYTHIQTFSI